MAINPAVLSMLSSLLSSNRSEGGSSSYSYNPLTRYGEMEDKGRFWGDLFMGGGLGLFSGKKKQEDDPLAEWLSQPEYPEAKGAREDLWKKLQLWGGQPGYGAIAPNWEDIWQTAQNKVRQYYWGSATSPGAVSKVRASAARRNVSESPALEKGIGRMAVEEGEQLKGMATQQATEKAEFSERGRQNWINQMIGMSKMSPLGQFFQTQDQPSQGNLFTMLGGVGKAASNLMAENNQRKWLDDLMKKTSAGGE